ncbi:hypothetical protein AB0M43_29050 [Longispora sp. NPDC051575]
MTHIEVRALTAAVRRSAVNNVQRALGPLEASDFLLANSLLRPVG